MPKTIVPADGEATPAARLLTAAGPTLLRHAIRMKRERGDADVDQFKEAVRLDFASGMDATIGGAIRAYTQWTAKADKIGWWPARLESRMRILADLQAIEAGTFFQRTAA